MVLLLRILQLRRHYRLCFLRVLRFLRLLFLLQAQMLRYLYLLAMILWCHDSRHLHVEEVSDLLCHDSHCQHVEQVSELLDLRFMLLRGLCGVRFHNRTVGYLHLRRFRNLEPDHRKYKMSPGVTVAVINQAFNQAITGYS
jgi:hypothetical protein